MAFLYGRAGRLTNLFGDFQATTSRAWWPSEGGAVPQVVLLGCGFLAASPGGLGLEAIFREARSFPPPVAQRWPYSIALSLQPPCNYQSPGAILRLS